MRADEVEPGFPERSRHWTGRGKLTCWNPGNALPLQDGSVEVWPRREHFAPFSVHVKTHKQRAQKASVYNILRGSGSTRLAGCPILLARSWREGGIRGSWIVRPRDLGTLLRALASSGDFGRVPHSRPSVGLEWGFSLTRRRFIRQRSKHPLKLCLNGAPEVDNVVNSIRVVAFTTSAAGRMPAPAGCRLRRGRSFPVSGSCDRGPRASAPFRSAARGSAAPLPDRDGLR